MRWDDEPLDGLQVYLQDITPFRPLSRAEEGRLSAQGRAGDEGARQRLATANLRFVVRIAHGYRHRGLALEELIAEGNVGLLEAVHRFDGTRGHKFITYAVWWIRQAILKALGAADAPVRTPINQRQSRHRLKRARGQVSQKLGRTAALSDVAGHLGWSTAQAEAAGALSFHSLDTLHFSDGREPIGASLVDEAAGVEPLVEQAALVARLERELAALPPREATILRAYYGLDGTLALTLEQIGRGLGLTRERVRQLRNRALVRLRTRSGAALRGFTLG